MALIVVLVVAAIWDEPIWLFVGFGLMCVPVAWQLFKDARWVVRWLRRRGR